MNEIEFLKNEIQKLNNELSELKSNISLIGNDFYTFSRSFDVDVATDINMILSEEFGGVTSNRKWRGRSKTDAIIYRLTLGRADLVFTTRPMLKEYHKRIDYRLRNLPPNVVSDIKSRVKVFDEKELIGKKLPAIVYIDDILLKDYFKIKRFHNVIIRGFINMSEDDYKNTLIVYIPENILLKGAANGRFVYEKYIKPHICVRRKVKIKFSDSIDQIDDEFVKSMIKKIVDTYGIKELYGLIEISGSESLVKKFWEITYSTEV